MANLIVSNAIDTFMASATAAAARGNLGLAIGADVQAHSAILDATTASFLAADRTKLDGVAAGATVNSADAVLLARGNHTGTQAAATIVDFAASVAGNAAVVQNTAKVTNATHTGDVTGSAALTITAGVVTNAKLAAMAEGTIKGRVAAGAGEAEDLSPAQVRTMLALVIGMDVQAHSAILDATTASFLTADRTQLDTIAGMTAGSILFSGVGGAVAEDNANLFWDDANNRLGIGAVPTAVVDARGSRFNFGNTAFNTGFSADYILQTGVEGSSANSYGILVKAGTTGVGKIAFDSGVTTNGMGRIWYDHAVNTMLLYTNNSEKVRITSAGNFGIGVTPAEKLDVLGTIRGGTAAHFGSLILAGTYSGDNYLNTLGGQFSSGGTVLGFAIKPKSGSAGYVSSAGNAAFGRSAITMDGAGFHFLTATAATVAIGSDVTMTERLTVLTNGNVGIGTIPATLFEMKSPSSSILTVSSTSPGTNASPIEGKLQFRGFNNIVHAEIASQDRTQNLVGGWLVFRTDDSSAVLQDRMMIDRSGNVGIGIGITPPDARVHVTPTAAVIGQIIRGAASQSANLCEWQSSAAAIYGTISENGYFTTRKNSAPADAELSASEVAIWFDSTNGAASVQFKGKTVDGTVVAGSVALT